MLRERAAAALRLLRTEQGLSVDEWASRWSDALGRTISPELVRAWEKPTGPKPMLHWALAAFLLAKPAAEAVFSSLLS